MLERGILNRHEGGKCFFILNPSPCLFFTFGVVTWPPRECSEVIKVAFLMDFVDQEESQGRPERVSRCITS